MNTHENHEYESAYGHSNKTRFMQAGASMKKEYDCIMIENSAGMKICFEFPKEAESNEEIAREVKAILSDELRDSLRKNAG